MNWWGYILGAVVAVAALWLARPVIALYFSPQAQLAAEEPAADQVSIHTFTAEAIDGTPYPLAQHAGQVLLVVNTASRCGLTKQYAGLQALQERFGPHGFSVIAFPCNDFMGQEPGTASEIQTFCQTNYNTSFPLMNKISVKGAEAHPLYRYLTEQSPFPGAIRWNFDKFLIDNQGRVVGRFSPRVQPVANELVAAIKALLPAAADATPSRTAVSTSDTSTQEASPATGGPGAPASQTTLGQ